MKIKKGNTIIIALLIVGIISIIITAASTIIYLVYFRVIELKEQIYLNINSNSYKNKIIIDYINNPLSYFGNKLDGKNLVFHNFSRYVYAIEDSISPGENSIFILSDLEDEYSQNKNNIKKIVLFYNKENENEDISINFIRWEKNNIENLKTGKITLLKTENICSDVCIPLDLNNKYKNKFILTDFTENIDTKKYNYSFFFNSKNGISYSLGGLDSNNNKIKIPSKYIDVDFNMFTSNNKLSSSIKNKINLYDNYSINISKSLYDIQ